jgi:hypothetical protein
MWCLRTSEYPEPSSGFGVLVFAACSGRGSGRAAGGLVVAGRVEGELADELAGGGVDDAYLEVVDEHQDAGSGVGPADADVVEAAVVAEGEFAVGVDAVGADAVVVVGGLGGGGGFGPGRVDGGRGGPVGQGAVRPGGVVDAGEGVEQVLELGEGGGLAGLAGQPFPGGLLEPLGLALGSGWGGRSSAGSPAGAARAPGRCGRRRTGRTVPLSVRVEAGMPCCWQAARKAASTMGPVTR